MGRRPYNRPLFIRFILEEDIPKKLKIPAKYVRLHGATLSKKCELQSGQTHESMTVRTKQIDNDLYFSKGWKKFAKLHSLDYGDVLIFRHVNNSTFYVDVLDKNCTLKEPAAASEVASENHDQPSPDEITADHRRTKTTGVVKNGNALMKAEELRSRSKFPNFQITMRPIYVKGYMVTLQLYSFNLHIPREYAKEHVTSGTRLAKIKSSDKEWTVKVLNLKNESRFNAGWTNVVRAESIKLNDVCVFELINPRDHTLKLTIFRHSSEGGTGKKINQECEVKLDSLEESEVKSEPLDDQSEFNVESNKKWLYINAKKKAKKFQATLNHHSCVIHMKSSYIRCGILHVPRDFAKEMRKEESVFLVKLLSSSSGEEWNVKMRYEDHISRITTGWPTFVKDNSIAVDNFCVFELVNRRDAVIKISTF